MDSGGQHGLRFVLLRHTHRSQRRPYPFVEAGEETPNTGVEAVKAEPGCSREGHSRVGRCRVLRLNVRSLVGYPTIPHSVGDPPSASHVCCSCQMN